MVFLKNDRLAVGIKKKGAELASVFSAEKNREYMWQADETIWPWHAPNLFPVVGGLIDNNLLHQGIKYPMPRHGFARHSLFHILESSDDHAILALNSTDESLKSYPFRFEFQVRYDLQDSALRILYKVINLDEGSIWFSLGGHPAFRVPVDKQDQFSDYHLEFPGATTLQSYRLSGDGFLTGETEQHQLAASRLPLNRELFANDALVLKNIDFEEVRLKNSKGNYEIRVSVEAFNDLGLWSKPGADFVCIEPWMGFADSVEAQLPIEEKAGIITLAHGHTFKRSYTIDFH